MEVDKPVLLGKPLIEKKKKEDNSFPLGYFSIKILILKGKFPHSFQIIEVGLQSNNLLPPFHR